MDDHDDLTDRLAQLGSAPVPDDVRRGHLHAMQATAPAPEAPRRFGRIAVAAAALVGFAAGSTGFAMAGALPDPAQRVAHDVLAVVNIEAPDRPHNRGACVSVAAKAGDHEAKAACKAIPRPGRSGEAPGRSEEAPGQRDLPPDHPNFDSTDCMGKPPWAGPMDRTTREELKHDRADCRGADEDLVAEAEQQRREAAEDAAEAEAEADAQQEADAQEEADAQQEAEPVPPADAGPPPLPEDAPADVPAGGEPPPETEAHVEPAS